MQIGIKFPTREIGTDPGVIRDWAIRAHALGFSHVILIDHVLGVDPEAHPEYGAQFPVQGSRPPYVVSDEFHEPLMMLAFIAAVCPGLELVTGILISPQRQTALLAKQAAELDVLCAGRLRLCLGIGWNPVEYDALGVPFATRSRRFETQVAALRALWTQETVQIDDGFDRITGVGLAPNAIQRPIPIWIGGWHRKVLERIGRIADGWCFGHDLPDQAAAGLEVVRAAAAQTGRDPDAIGLEGAVELRNGFDTLTERMRAWKEIGATHLAIDPMLGGFRGAEHVELLDRIAAATDGAVRPRA